MPDSKSSIFIYYHTHWDREWYEPFSAFQVRLADVVDQVLDRLDSGILPCFTLDGQTSLLSDYLEFRPENEERLRHYIENGPINIGPWYVMPDEFLVSGESLIRNLKRGIEEAQAWGCHQFTGYLPDTFGHSADIPLILKHFGIDSAVVWRGVNPETSEFIWKSRDGSAVLGYHLAEGYFQNMLHDPELTDDERVTALLNLQKKALTKSASQSVLLPLGGDHLGPITAEGKKILNKKTIFSYTSGHPVDYLRMLTEQVRTAKLNLPVLEGELTDNSVAFLLPGVWSSRMYLKQANRMLEYATLPKLEQQIAMNQRLNFSGQSQRLPYPKHELHKLWTLLLQNHPHDSICGCSVDAVHRENEVRFDAANQIAHALTTRLNHQLAQSATEEEWVVLNPTDAPYTGLVKVVEQSDLDPDSLGFPGNATDKQGETFVDNYRWNSQDVPQAHRTQKRFIPEWLWVDKLAPHSVTRLKKTKVKDLKPTVPVQDFHHNLSGKKVYGLENQWIRVEASQEKGIQLFNKQTDECLCQQLNLAMLPEYGDSYSSSPGTTKQGTKQDQPWHLSCQIKPMKEGLENQLSVCYTHKNTAENWVLTLILRADSPLLQGHLSGRVGAGTAQKLQLQFLSNSPLEQLQCESHFGLVTRNYDPSDCLISQIPASPMKELKSNTGPIQRFIMTPDQLWLTKGLTEYEVINHRLGVTVFRSFSELSSDQTGVRGAQAGPPFKTPEGMLTHRKIEAEFAWAPLSSRETGQSTEAFAYEMAQRFYQPLSGFSGKLPCQKPVLTSQSYSLIQWDNRDIVSHALKCPDNDSHGLIVRLVNISAQPQPARIQVGFDYTHVVETDFMETIQSGESLDLKNSPLRFAPYEVKTLHFQVE